MRSAELQLAHTLVAAPWIPTATFTAAVFGTETLALNSCGAAHHGARLLLLSTGRRV